MKIGIFDSGRGGRFVAEKLRLLLPEHDYTVINDRVHAPYGERAGAEIEQLTLTAIQPILNNDCIILACNTATAAALDTLRVQYPKKIFIGFEPMIKPAAAGSESHHLTLLATHATAFSTRTESLMRRYAADTTVDRIVTVGWAQKIDANQATAINLSEVATSIAAGSDAIIIGCTHYSALIPRLQHDFPGIRIYEPTVAVARRIKSLEL